MLCFGVHFSPFPVALGTKWYHFYLKIFLSVTETFLWQVRLEHALVQLAIEPPLETIANYLSLSRIQLRTLSMIKYIQLTVVPPLIVQLVKYDRSIYSEWSYRSHPIIGSRELRVHRGFNTSMPLKHSTQERILTRQWKHLSFNAIVSVCPSSPINAIQLHTITNYFEK